MIPQRLVCVSHTLCINAGIPVRGYVPGMVLGRASSERRATSAKDDTVYSRTYGTAVPPFV